MKKKVKSHLKSNKCCLLINADPADQIIFMAALHDVAPDTFFMLATDGEEAIEILEHCELIPDCVFLELAMEGIDGVKILCDLKKRVLLKNVPVIVHAPSDVRSNHNMEVLKMGAAALCFNPYSYYGVKYLLHLYFKNDVRVLLN